MKKFSLFLLSFFLIIFCCSCKSSEPSTVENSSDGEEVVNEIEVSETITLKGNFLSEYENIDAPDISKFLGTAIVKVRPEEYQNNDIPVISKDSKNADYIFTVMHLNPEYLDEYAISLSENSTRAYTVAVIKSKPNFEEDAVVGMSTRISDLYKSMKNYPDQMYLVEHAVMEQAGDYLVLVICDNADKVFEQIYKVMGNTDLTTIESVPLMTDEELEKIEKEALDEELANLDSDVEDVIVTPIEDTDIVNSENEAEVKVNE